MPHTCLLGHPLSLDGHALPGLSSSRNWPLFSCVTPPISSLAANLSLKWNVRKEASLLCCEHTCTHSQTLWVPDASPPARLGEGLEAFICQISGTWEPCRDFSWSGVHGNSVCVLSRLSRVWFFVTPWTAAHQALLPKGFSRQEYWSELPCPPPGDLPDPGIKPVSLRSPALACGFFTASATWETFCTLNIIFVEKQP